MTAPSCPTSFSQIPGPPREWFADLVNSIPRAHDLPSAIRALRTISNVVNTLINNQSAVNNTSGGSTSTSPDGEKTTVPGSNINPYPASDWIEQSRSYKIVRLENPDNRDQFIELDVITGVTFVNEGTGHSLRYEGPWV